MTDTLQDKVALVTGGSGGIGSETARRLAQRGAKVAVHYFHSKDDADRVVSEIKAAGGEALAIQGNASVEADCTRIIDETLSAFGALDILVNNAGISTFLEFGKISADDIDREFGTNVRSVVLMTQAAAPHLKSGAKIVNVSSNIAYAPIPGLTVYCAAKAAVATLTKGLARELGKQGITVNSVAPGVTETPMTAWIDQPTRDGMADETPLGRIAQPDDIADIIIYLASPESRWVNGQTILADGGLV
ncbi:MAG: 3-oxoacyl-[acyl-carrier protein] reductase [Halieaceae bacterium]